MSVLEHQNEICRFEEIVALLIKVKIIRIHAYLLDSTLLYIFMAKIQLSIKTKYLRLFLDSLAERFFSQYDVIKIFKKG